MVIWDGPCVVLIHTYTVKTIGTGPLPPISGLDDSAQNEAGSSCGRAARECAIAKRPPGSGGHFRKSRLDDRRFTASGEVCSNH